MVGPRIGNGESGEAESNFRGRDLCREEERRKKEREREIEEALRPRRATISLRASNFYDGATGPGRANTRGDQPLSTTFHRLANVRCAHIPLESGSLRRLVQKREE